MLILRERLANKTAIVVSECPFNCLTCTDTGDGVPTMKCTTCKYQYVLNEGDCGACPRYCLKCSGSSSGLTCIQCQNETVMMSDGTCERKCDRSNLRQCRRLSFRAGFTPSGPLFRKYVGAPIIWIPPPPQLPSPDMHSSHHRHFVEDPCILQFNYFYSISLK